MHTDTFPFYEFSWATENRADALAAIINTCGISDASNSSSRSLNTSKLNSIEKIPAIASALGIDCEQVTSDYRDIEATLKGIAPGVIQLTANDTTRYFAVVSSSEKSIKVLTPTLTVENIALEDLRAALCKRIEQTEEDNINRILEQLKIPAKRQQHTKQTLLREKLGREKIAGLWILRPQPEASLWSHIKFNGLHKRLATLLSTYSIYYLLWLGSWSVIGFGALNGTLASGWIIAWGLALLTMVPFRMWFVWQQGALAIGIGTILKRQLLAGAMYLSPETMRKEGIGQLFGRVMESHEFEDLSLSGGITAVVALLELLIASFVLSSGVAGSLLTALLYGYLVITGIVLVVIYKKTQQWTRSRVKLTNSFVENMAGHRTRLAQEAPENWHTREDPHTHEYAEQSRSLDNRNIFLDALPRGWLFVGLAAIGYAFVFSAPHPVELAIGLGAVLLCYRAITSLAGGIQDLARAAIAWHNLAPFFHVLANVRQHTQPLVPAAQPSEKHLIEARGLCFQHPRRPKPILANSHLNIAANSRLLLEGPSGSGKSTLATILAGLRNPNSGLLLLDGLDAASWGQHAWRRKAIMVPQFHENHIFMGHFAFNLLMGREWPPGQAALEEAYEVCEALGLGPLLEKMPGGMMQLVGDTGWQLSHGEKSRVYIARALLQGADLLIFDESFAALDPENTQRALEYVMEKSKALMVIAHP